ncbi:MAG TPA: molybdate ABC transporter substrate-binding protein [Terracidiphilus sp.]|nr:molybdate ABC transporter substrate-binding protein [Terracidiphilus sp.]
MRWLLAALAMMALVPAATAQTTLRLAAAADLAPVLPALLKQFQSQTGIHVVETYQASAMLTAQIENGAPFDLFLAADMEFPARLVKGGLADEAAPVPYAKGTLVLWTRKDAHLPPPSLALLRSPALERLAIANPDRAPYGRAAVAALKSLKLYDALKGRIAQAENIGQAAQFVQSGNAQAGLIALTAALTPQLAKVGSYFVIPRDLYPPLEQGAVVLRASGHRAEAHRLLAFLLSAPVQAQLEKRGLSPVR